MTNEPAVPTGEPAVSDSGETAAVSGRDTGPAAAESGRRGVSRRRLLGAGAAGLAGVTVVAAGGAAAHELLGGDSAAQASNLSSPVPFHGEHQAGITTPAQDRLHFVAFDVTTSKREELITLLKAWTKAAERMTQGKDAGPIGAVARRPRGSAGRHR